MKQCYEHWYEQVSNKGRRRTVDLLAREALDVDHPSAAVYLDDLALAALQPHASHHALFCLRSAAASRVLPQAQTDLATPNMSCRLPTLEHEMSWNEK